jgi:carbonic anhydrase
MEKILEGVRKFRSEVYAAQPEFYQRLARTPQSPRALFITCSDSRINPNLLTQTEPGELFILRNAGNIVPPHGAAAGGEGGTIEYAVAVLGLRHIIVCGHWNCGAMAGLLEGCDRTELPAVAAWFGHAEATRRIVAGRYADLPRDQRLGRLAEHNVLVQIDNLRTHPSVAAGLARGELHLYGWVYRIETGEVFAYDPGQRAFVSLTDRGMDPIPSPAVLAEPYPV